MMHGLGEARARVELALNEVRCFVPFFTSGGYCIQAMVLRANRSSHHKYEGLPTLFEGRDLIACQYR